MADSTSMESSKHRVSKTSIDVLENILYSILLTFMEMEKWDWICHPVLWNYHANLWAQFLSAWLNVSFHLRTPLFTMIPVSESYVLQVWIKV